MTLTRRLSCAVLAAALLFALAPVPPAAATSTYLCTGYTGCQEEGRPHYGYKKAGKKMWWRMYAGHNCTNYVAYRMVKGGMSAERPWSSTGMAYNWGRAKSGITDRRPMVGSVAWWKKNAGGVGSSGHVAYVEKVISRTKIVISEDSWSGDFHWRRIRKSGGGWPSGFIHFNDREVRPLARPAISGDPAVGETLTATVGRWSPAARHSVQWFAGDEPIAGATSARFTPTPAQRRQRLAVRVTATSRGYVPGTARSDRTARVSRGTLAVTSRPAVTGTPRVGEVLEVLPAAWSPTPESTQVRWFADGEPIPGATGRRLRLAPAHSGQRITVRMQARREGYHRSVVTSERTAAVAEGDIEVTSPFALAGELRMGSRLTVSPGTVDPGDAKVTYAWLRNDKPVAGATGRSYDLDVDDVGGRIALRVRLARDGYRDRTVLLAPDGRVTTKPVLRLEPVGKRERVVVRLRVTAPGVEVAGGPAEVRIGSHAVTRRLVDGRLRVVLDGIDPGTRTVRVAYAGTEVVRAAQASATVRVLRRRG